jgi:DNA-binding LacI/PurR family transcriptional regulator
MSTKSVRLADVARAAGVSQGTASNVFNRPDVVREDLRERVHAAAKALGYLGPDPRGRMLRAGKANANAVGIVAAEPLSYFFEDPFARVLMSGIAEACDAHGAGIALLSAQNGEKLAWNLQSALVDGFILVGAEGGPHLLELTRERQLPFVALGIRDPTIATIGVDDFAGAKRAASHLAELGHRRFAILAKFLAADRLGLLSMAQVWATLHADSRDRVLGYLAALAEFGVDATSVPIVETQDEEASVGAALQMLWASAAPPTALLAMSDRIALAALDWLRQRGKTVPRDVSVIGFDGVPDGALSQPPLTTVVQPIAEIGRLAVSVILEHDGRVRRERLDVELLVRGSTAPPP